MSGENKRNVRPVKVGGLVLDGKRYISINDRCAVYGYRRLC